MLQQMETGEFYLIDLGSRNGSFVNGRRVSIPVTLRNGDRIIFGQTELDFYNPTAGRRLDRIHDNDSEDFTATLTVRSLISVMVMDIRDFTVLTRQLDETLLSEVIGNWFRKAGQIIREHGSWVDKYIGDAIMAVFQSFLGDLDRQPALARPLHELASAPISPRAAFLLSRIDGMLTIDEILDVSGMPRLEAYRHLTQLFLRGILR